MATARRPIGYAGGAFLNPNVSTTPPVVTTRPVARNRQFVVKRTTGKLRVR